MTPNRPREDASLPASNSGGGGRIALACLAEAALAPVALLIAWCFQIPLLDLLSPAGRQGQACVIGLLATGPMVIFLVVFLNATWPPLAALRQQAQSIVGRLAGNASVAQVVALAVIAGIGEELLFRGALQPLLADWVTPWGSVLVVGVLFGLVHPISRAYVVVATIGGLYLGALAQWQGEVLSAIVAHAAYDIVALLWLRQRGAAQSEDHSSSLGDGV